MGAPIWTLSLPVNVQGEIAINSRGEIIASTAVPVDDLYRPMVVGISSDGDVVFEHEVGLDGPFSFPSRPVLGMDDGIYVASSRSLYALQPDGRLRWTLDRPVKADGTPFVNTLNPPPPPAIGPDGTVYWQFLAATSKDGELKWREYVDPSTPCETALPVRPDRVLFRGGNQIFAFDERGEVSWNADEPSGLFTDPGCGMVPYRDGLVASSWCEPGVSAFVCGHVVFQNVDTGAVEWTVEPPKKVATVTTMVLDEDMSILLFSAGPAGNPDDRARMWSIHPDGTMTSPSVELPWHGVWSASLGDDGIVYVTTTRGVAAITRQGEVLWRYEPEFNVGRFTSTPAIGDNGCVYTEVVKQFSRFDFDRQLVCLRSSATGPASSAWPRSLGGNHSGMSTKY